MISWKSLELLLFDIYIKQFHSIEKIWKAVNFTSNQFITDEYYDPFMQSQLNEYLDNWNRNELPNLHYVYDVYDCDDFSFEFDIGMKRYFRSKYNIIKNGVGFAWGLLCYGNSCGGHAWNIVLLGDGGYGLDRYGFGVVFIEPQTGEVLNISVDKYLKITSPDGFRYIFYGVII